jgi:hypothetical protein
VNPDEPIFAVADALGPDFIELAPADEGHFDGSGVALLVAAATVSAVGSGIAAGIRQTAQEGTVLVIKKAAAQIRRRLSGSQIRQVFSTESTPQAHEAALDAAASQFAAAVRAARDLEAAQQAQLAELSAAAVRDALQRHGLRAAAASRVQRAVELQITVSLRQQSAFCADHEPPDQVG